MTTIKTEGEYLYRICLTNWKRSNRDFSLYLVFDLVKDETLKEGKAVGGDGGSRFDDAHDLGLTLSGKDRHRCISVEIHWDRGSDNKLTSICFNYRRTSEKYFQFGKHHGRDQGKIDSLDLNQDIFYLKSNDAIERITVYTGRRQRFLWDPRTIAVITGIQFQTVQGDVSEIFGSTNDTEATTEYYPGYTLAYAKGRAGIWIDRLQFVWSKAQQDRKFSDEIVHF